MNPPIFVDDNGDLNIFGSAKSAESYLEPENINDPTMRIYDSEGRLLVLIHDPPDDWSSLFGAPGRKIHLEQIDEEPKHANQLRDALRSFLKYHKLSDEQLQSEPLSRLVELSLPYLSKY